MVDRHPTTYYERKVFTRAEGILDTCLIARHGYRWGAKSDTGSRVLAFVLEPDVDQAAVDRALEYMRAAFRKAVCYRGPEAVYKAEPENRYPTIVVEFDKEAR